MHHKNSFFLYIKCIFFLIDSFLHLFIFTIPMCVGVTLCIYTLKYMHGLYFYKFIYTYVCNNVVCIDIYFIIKSRDAGETAHPRDRSSTTHRILNLLSFIVQPSNDIKPYPLLYPDHPLTISFTLL